MFVLDTNVLSEPLKPEPDERVTAALRRHEAELATTAVVWHELWFGVTRLARGRRRRLLEAYLTDVLEPAVRVLPYDVRAARWHASERARLEVRGRVPGFADGQIAAVAAANDATLVTRNVADFRRFKGVRVVRWHAR